MSAISATYIKMSAFRTVLSATTDPTECAIPVPSLVLLAFLLQRLAFHVPPVSITIHLLEPVVLFPTATMVKWKFKVSAPGFALPIGISTKLPASALALAATSRTALAAALSPLPPTSAPSLFSCKATPVWLSASLDSTLTQRLAPAWPAHPLAKLAFLLTTV